MGRKDEEYIPYKDVALDNMVLVGMECKVDTSVAFLDTAKMDHKVIIWILY